MSDRPLVLIVEDSHAQERLIAHALRAAGYPAQVHGEPTAEDGWRYVQRMKATPREAWPVFAIVDLGLPGESGMDLLQRIRADPMLREWPVVVFTGSRDPEDRRNAGLSAATAYFTKPGPGMAYQPVAREILDAVGPMIGWARTQRPSRRN